MMWNGPASIVDSHSVPTVTETSDSAPVVVVRVTGGKPHLVYDLKVDDDVYREFFANGILVHNCTRYGLMGAAAASRRHPHRSQYLVGSR